MIELNFNPRPVKVTTPTMIPAAAQVEATVKANPSIKMMLYTLRRAVEEILTYTELIPEEFTQNAGSYYRFGSNLLQPNFHITAHIQQIKDALAAAGK